MDGWMEIFKVEKLRWILDERKVKSRGKLWMDGWNCPHANIVLSQGSQ